MEAQRSDQQFSQSQWALGKSSQLSHFPIPTSLSWEVGMWDWVGKTDQESSLCER